MDRTPISLDAERHRRLGEEAQRRGISFASLLHGLIDEQLSADEQEQEQPLAADPLAALIGIGEGTGKAIGRHHNRHLYEP
jgi:hypothetical protein